MKIKGLGLCNWSLPIPMRGPISCKIAKEAGLDGLELELGIAEENFPLANPYVLDAFHEAKEQYGMFFTGVAANLTDFFPMTAPKGDPGKDMVERGMKLAIDAAAALGAPLIHAPSFLVSQINTEEDLKNTAVTYQLLCDYAAEKGILVCTENNLDAETQLREIEMVNRDNFKVYFDTQNYYLRGMDTPDLIAKICPYIAESHVKDGIDQCSTHLLGEGASDIFASLEAFDKAGYKEWLVFENYYSKPPLCGPEDDFMELLRKDVMILKKWLSEHE